MSDKLDTNKLKKTVKENFNVLGGVVIIGVLVVGVLVTNLLLKQTQDIRQRAAPPGTPTATININPGTNNVSVGQQFTVSLVIDGGGQAFNAAQANISVSSNLSVTSLTINPPGSGGCNFTFVNANKTPKVSDPSFAGAILNSSSTNCTLFTMNVVAQGIGTGTITITKPSVKAYSNSSEIFLSAQNGSYTIGAVPTATPTSLPTPTNTPTPTLTPTNTPTPTPTPTVSSPPTINAVQTPTYLTSVLLSGVKLPEITAIFVNNSQTGVVLTSQTTWEYQANLNIGPNNFTVYGQNSAGVSSTSVSVTITVHRMSDINGDNVIDLTDLSIFGSDWESTGPFNSLLSDMNGDNLVDLEDFSILARNYGN